MPRTPVSKSPTRPPKRRPGTPPPPSQTLDIEPLTTPRPHTPPGLPEPIEPTPATMLATGSAAVYQRLRSSMHADGFQHHEGSVFPLAPVDERDARGTIELKPPHIDELPLPADELEALSTQMFEQARKLSPLEAHTLDALSHIWIKQAQHPEARAVVDIDELLALRGLKPKKGGSGRRGGYMPEQRLEMLHALARIRNLWLRIDELSTYEDNGKKAKKERRQTRRGVAGPAFVITGVGGQTRLDGGLDVDRVSFTPGEVLSLYLWGPGRQTAVIDAKILRYDPYRQEPESMLARYLSWLWKVRATKGTYSEPLRVSTLLKESRLQLNTKEPARTRDRMEKTLDTLQRDGVIRSWRYESWSLADAPRVGWAEPWLRELVIIEPAASVVSYYLEHHRGALPDGEPAPLADRLRATRERLELTQAQASEAADVSQQAYSRAERGKGVAAKNRSKLEMWLASNQQDAPDVETR